MWACLQLPRLSDLQLTREGVVAFAAAAGGLHGYAVELALEMKTSTPGQLHQAGERAVARLKDQGGLSQEEAEALSGLMAAIEDPNLDHNEKVLAAISAKAVKWGPVATMLLAIARDSMARDRKRADLHPHPRSRLRSFLAWGGDVVGAGVGGSVGFLVATPTGPGAIVASLLVGGVAGAAASAAILAA